MVDDASRIDRDRLVGALGALEPDALRRPSDVRVVRAPGRVNLIGEYTDINLGFVLPAAIDLEIHIALLPTDDGRVRLSLLASDATLDFDLAAIPPRGGSWTDYVTGTAWAMRAAGFATAGFRGVLASSLPQGAGLSSSAALELATAWALSAGSPPGVDGLTLARTCQRAENEYVGVRSGLMDQAAASLGVADSGLLLDCRSFEYRAVPLPLDEVVLAVCHSGVARRLAGSAYNTRRADCDRALRAVATVAPWVASLRDVDMDLLDRCRERMDDTAYARAGHVVTENGRVLAVEAALGSGDLETVGRLFAESHASLRDRFEVSSTALDALVSIAADIPGVVAARMTGAGFGGCTVNLVRGEAVDRFAAHVGPAYRARTGLDARVMIVNPAAGASFA